MDELRDLVRAELGRWHVPGAAVGILAGGETTVVAEGVARLDTGAPVEPGSCFRVASITKPFTASLCLALGLDLDGVVLDDAITLRHLLSHTAGLDGELLIDQAILGTGDDALARGVQHLAGVRRVVPPGTLWSYANSGYWLAGHLCAQAAGTTFEQALADHVLDPLGLTATSFEHDGSTSGHVQTVPGGDEHEVASTNEYPRARRPSGGLVSTVGDLLRFAELQLEAGAPYDQMQSPVADTGQGSRYGLGLAIDEIGGAAVVGHDGSYGGYQTTLRLVPGHGLALAVLTNSTRGATVVEAVAAWVAEQFLGSRGVRPQPVEVADDALARLDGRYENPETVVTVSHEPGRVLLDVVERVVNQEPSPYPTIVARPLSETEFVVEGGELDGDRLDFVLEDGRARFARVFSRLAERDGT